MPRIGPAVAFPGLALALALLPAPVSAAVYYYSAILNPRQEVPPVTSNALGGGRFVIDTDANTVTYWISFAGLSGSETLAHIHQAAAGTTGPPKHDLPPGNPKVGQWTYSEADEVPLLNGLMYANIHTGVNGNGEIRGQIVPFNALMGANQEIPVNSSTGKGWVIATVDTAINQLSYRIFYEGLTGGVTAAHFHGNTLQGGTASPKATLTVTPSPMVGTAPYNPADEGAVLAGRWYVNLHTATNPGGEIRGQLVPRVVPMDALQETPINFQATSAGIAMVAIDTTANILGYDVRVLALSGPETQAHIHGYAGLGSNAPPLLSLTLGAMKIGQWTYGAADEAQVLLGRAYFNSNTSANPDGEIRGQIMALPGAEALLGVGDGPSRPGIALTAAPNPAGGRTRLTLELPRGGRASLAIIGVDGRRVRALADGVLAPGPHSYEWDGRDDGGREVAPGVYFAIARTSAGDQVTRLARLR